MNEWSKWVPFTEANINASAPDKKGVYALQANGRVVYYGMSDQSIKARLLSHVRGAESPASQNATSFCYQECANPALVETALLNQFKKENGGKLPQYNTVG